MAHQEQFNFVSSVKSSMPEAFINLKVLEVGSLNINGTVRELFENCDYTGIDVKEGVGVDIVCQGQDYDPPDTLFDTVVSFECFEHNPFWVETFTNMVRLCKPSGIVLMSCASTGRIEHGTSRSNPNDSPLTISIGWEYYKNLTEKDFRESFELDDLFSQYEFRINDVIKDLYFVGVKK